MHIKAISFRIFSPISSLMTMIKYYAYTHSCVRVGHSHLTQIPFDSTRLPEKIKALSERNGERKMEIEESEHTRMRW